MEITVLYLKISRFLIKVQRINNTNIFKVVHHVTVDRRSKFSGDRHGYIQLPYDHDQDGLD